MITPVERSNSATKILRVPGFSKGPPGNWTSRRGPFPFPGKVPQSQPAESHKAETSPPRTAKTGNVRKGKGREALDCPPPVKSVSTGNGRACLDSLERATRKLRRQSPGYGSRSSESLPCKTKDGSIRGKSLLGMVDSLCGTIMLTQDSPPQEVGVRGLEDASNPPPKQDDEENRRPYEKIGWSKCFHSETGVIIQKKAVFNRGMIIQT